MSSKKKPPTVKPQPNAVNNGVATVLDAEAMKAIAGFLDVLVQWISNRKQAMKVRKANENK